MPLDAAASPHAERAPRQPVAAVIHHLAEENYPFAVVLLKHLPTACNTNTCLLKSSANVLAARHETFVDDADKGKRVKYSRHPCKGARAAPDLLLATGL